MTAWQRYLQPHSIDEALRRLQEGPGRTQLIAGGTDLLLDLQQGRAPAVDALVDVSGIAEMAEIRATESGIFIGAAVTHDTIIHHDLIRQHAAGLVTACGLIGGPQVRNVATLGGNVAHALPAGDGTIALLALGAQAQIADPEGRRWLPIEELFVGPGLTVLHDRCALLAGFQVPFREEREGNAFSRVMRPQGVAIAILNLGAWLRVAPDGTIGEIRLAMGPAGPVPFRARRTEDYLRGRRLDDETLAQASAGLVDEATLRSSPHRATRGYRQHLVPTLLGRVLRAAYREAVVSE